MEKLLDGVDVEWKSVEEIIVDKFWIMPATPEFNEDEEIPYITSKNIRGGNINFDKVKFVSRSDYLELSRNRPILAGDILISMIGTIGEVARVKDTDLDFYGQNMYLIRLDNNLINSDFFLHFFDAPEMKSHFNSVKNNSGQGYLKAKDIENLQIPIPPIKIQEEIVRILDAFTEHTAELTTELTAELTAREKQYTYYRDKLLTFEEDEVEWKTLGEVAKFRRGSFPQPYGNAEWYDGEGAMPFVQVVDVGEDMQLVQNTKNKISKLAQPKSVFVKEDTVIVTLQGSIGRVAITQYDCYVDRTLAIFESFQVEIHKKYFAYQLQAKFAFEKENARGSTIKTITKAEFTKFQIPIPPLNEQARIISILDKFNVLTSSITEGLSREIEFRQKQYEYYRTMLLSFPKSEVEA